MLRLLRNPAGLLGLVITVALVGVALFAAQLAPSDPFRTVAPPLQAPSDGHLMGTDNLGRDVLSGVIHGARTSTQVVLWVVAIATVIGVAVGAVAGFRAGLVDDLLMRVTDLFQSVPRFFLALLVIALFGAGVDNLILVLGVTSWPLLARVVRADALSLRERDFVAAARSLGASDARILARHVLPNLLPSVIVVVSLLGSRIILLEASLSFIGLGDPNVMSWGYLTSNAQRFLRVAWWMSVFPGAAIALGVLGINLLGDALNDARNPQSSATVVS
ncbi:MAG: ABC transporter permease [Actinomycetota bacterium]|nr:ABC transporter permease [Actinomycetota bacterium]